MQKPLIFNKHFQFELFASVASKAGQKGSFIGRLSL